MPPSLRPNAWRRIERDIMRRAEHRCECGSFVDCDSNDHHGRCPNVEGNRYIHNKRLIKLRVIQVRPGSDWRAPNLIALCLPCLVRVEQRQAQREQRTNPIAAQQESMF